MKILFITPLLPYPPTDGWRLRTFNLIKHISNSNDITILSFIRPDEQKYIIELEKYANVITIPKKESKISLFFNIIKSYFGKTPLMILRDYSKEFVKKLKNLPYFDFIFFESLHSTQYTSLFKGNKIFDAHNVEHVIWQRCMKLEKSFFKKRFLKNQIKKIRKYELDSISKFKYILTCSENDKEMLDNGKNKFIIVPNGTNVDEIEISKTDPKNLLFIGALDYPPNKEAVIWFIKKILPLILSEIPDVRFYIIGKNPGKLKKLQNENIIFTDFVLDLKPYYDSSSIFVCPLKSGSGTRLKILEAMARKKAVISTSIGAEGLEIEHENNILIADEEKQFASLIIDLIKHPSKISELAENGYLLVKENYDWKKITKKIINLLSLENDKSDAHS